MENCKTFKFKEIIFGYFPALIQKIFLDSDFQRTGIAMVKPPNTFFNNNPINNRFKHQLNVDEVSYRKMTRVKSGVFNIFPEKKEVKQIPIKEYWGMKWPGTDSLNGINDIDEFEKKFWKQPESREQIYGYMYF